MAGEAKIYALSTCATGILPNCRKVLEIRPINLIRSLSAVALAKAGAFCASLWPKNLFTPLETCFFFLMGRNPWLINDLRIYKMLYNCRDTSTNVMSALQIKLFMQNEPKFRKSQMNVNKVLTKDYEKRTLGQHGKNEPKTNPNEPKFKKAKMNVTTYITKDYENKPPIWAPKKQSQTSKRQKPMQTSLPKGIMKKSALSVPDKTNPNEPNLSRRSLWRSRIKANFRGKKMLLRLTQCILCPAVFVCLKTKKVNIVLSKRLVYDMRAFWRYRECRT